MRLLDATRHTWLRPWARRIAGILWLGAWVVVVGAAHAPWRHLGGLVDERVRYWERVVLAAATIIGCFVGATARDAARPGSGRSHARLVRHVLVAPAGAAAILLLVLRQAGATDWIGVSTIGLLAYAAGLDIGIGAWPLLTGRHYSFTGPIEPDGPDQPGAGSGSGSNRPVRGDPRFR